MRQGDFSYDIRGEGPVLLMLHAFPFDRRIWNDTAAALAEKHRVVTMDFRGCGEAPLDGNFTIEDLADDAARLLDHLRVPMATVAGLSMGGYVALAFSGRHPARLAGLALCDTRATADSEAGRAARQDGIAAIQAGHIAQFLDGIPFRLLSNNASDDLRRKVRGLAEQRPEALTAALAAMRDRPDRAAELPSLRMPVLVVAGSDDTVTPPSEARDMAKAIPGAKYVELQGAGHLSNLEQPAAFCRTLSEFLDENRL